MTWTVLSVAYPFAPVGENAVGGAEQILGDLDRALAAAGHRSLVVACEGSRPTGTLFSFPLPRSAEWNEADKRWCRKQLQGAFDRALVSEHVDLIHLHGLDFLEYRWPKDIPALATLHMPPAWYPPQVWTRGALRVQLQCVSESQRRACPVGFGHLPVIENGVAVEMMDEPPARENFALVLGRICPEKNAHAAIAAGTRAATPVLLGGQVFPYREHLRYFEEMIQPLLAGTGVQHEFLGPLLPQRKQWLLSRTKCLLHPTLAPETSSLVAMEALAVGTPVIAYRSGALPEIVEHGVTGFLVDSIEEMAEAIRAVHTISPLDCRAAAERRFSKERMVRRYFELYAELAATGRRERRYA